MFWMCRAHEISCMSTGKIGGQSSFPRCDTVAGHYVLAHVEYTNDKLICRALCLQQVFGFSSMRPLTCVWVFLPKDLRHSAEKYDSKWTIWQSALIRMNESACCVSLKMRLCLDVS